MVKNEMDSDLDVTQMNSSTTQLDPKEKNKGKNLCKKITKFMFSHVGLVIIIMAYGVAGAFLFALLEQHKEAKDCQEGKGAESTNIVNLKSTLLTYIQFNISSVPSDTTKDNETVANEKIEQWLTDFRDQVLEVRSTYRYTGQDCSTTRWSFTSALLFAITIFTTIGYGHISPVTWEGQIVCICYATIGIPLFLMFMSNISSVLGDMFRFIYARICCRLCMRKNKKSKQQNNISSDTAQTATSIGAESQWANGGQKVKVIDQDDVEDDADSNENQDEQDKVTVPLTVSMLILTAYLVLGAFIFNRFENWDPVPAGYFCFISLSTIGFGDYVPGQNDMDPIKLTAAVIYIFLGMSIVAMCFDLMQEEIIAKFTWLGTKMGIVDKEDEDDDHEGDQHESNHGEDKRKEKENSKSSKEVKQKEKPNYVAEKTLFDSPVPSYSASDPDNRENMSRLRSAYLQNVVQRQYKS